MKACEQYDVRIPVLVNNRKLTAGDELLYSYTPAPKSASKKPLTHKEDKKASKKQKTDGEQ